MPSDGVAWDAKGARPAPRLVVLSDSERMERATMLGRLRRLAEHSRPGSVLLVLRDYQLSPRARLQLGRELGRITSAAQQWLGVADRVDLARLLDADALHLPERGMLAKDARALLGPRVLLSRACHDPRRAVEPDCDLVLLSPVIAPRKGNPPLGAAGVAVARAALGDSAQRPALFALGGVSSADVASCLRAGADGVAVIEAALAEDPRPLLAALGVLR